MSLTKTFEGFPTTINVCLFRKVRYDYPFLEFMFDEENQTFLSFTENAFLDKKEYDTYIMNKTILFLQDYIGDNTIIDKETKDNILSGFVQNGDVLFAFFDCSLLTLSKEFLYKTYDQICLETQMQPINMWMKLFYQHTWLFEELNQKNEVPIIVYPCIPQHDDKETEQINYIKKFDCEEIGYYYFFLREPIVADGKKSMIFISNPYLTTLFVDQRGREIWCIKTYSQIYDINI
jgi:hypothetical protein